MLDKSDKSHFAKHDMILSKNVSKNLCKNSFNNFHTISKNLFKKLSKTENTTFNYNMVGAWVGETSKQLRLIKQNKIIMTN